MNSIAFMVVLMAALLAFKNWRYGFALCVITALLQDPWRKLVPGQPVYFVVFVGAVFGAAWLGALGSRVPLAPRKIIGWKENVGTQFTLFVMVALLQAMHSLVGYGNLVMTGIGLMSYFAPLPAIALAYRFALARGERGIFRWMRFYVLAATVALVSVYLEYAGFTWQGLGEVGTGVLISGQGAYYKGNSGIFRAAEIAAWHAATVACFSFILFWGRRFSPAKVLVAIVFIAFLLGIGALTGRRKMVIEIAIFLSSYFGLIAWFKSGNARFAILSAVLGVLTYTVAVGVMQPDPGDGLWASQRLAQDEGDSFSKYTSRASSVFEDVPRRIMDMGFKPISWAVEGYGWFGGGLGVGSQGAQHFGVETSGAAEGGLGKLTVELGVPGLLVAFWLGLAFVRYIWRVLDLLAKTSPRHANLGFGLVAFIIANVAAFAVATQAYADVYILLTLGWAFGFLVSLPVFAREQAQTATAAAASATPAPAVEEGLSASTIGLNPNRRILSRFPGPGRE